MKEIAPLHFSVARRRFQLDVSPYAKEPANGGGWGNPGGRIGSPRAENCAGLVIGGGCGNPGGSIGSPRAEKLEGTADPVVCATGRQARTEAVIKMVQARNVVMKNLFIVVPFLCGWL